MTFTNVAPTWDQCREEYFWVDGSLRDLYVLNTTRREWLAFIDYVRAMALPITYEVRGEPQPLPVDVREAWLCSPRQPAGSRLTSMG